MAASMNLIMPPAAGAAKPVSAIRPQQYETWLSMSDEDKLAEAWGHWTNNLVFGIEARLAGVPVYRAVGASDLTPGHIGAEWCALRRYVGRILRGAQAAGWSDWPALRKALWEFHPGCVNTFLGKDVFWLGVGTRPRAEPSKVDDWNASAGAIIEQMLLGPLRWLGAVETVIESGRLTAFRLTETGKWLVEQDRSQNLPLPAVARAAVRASEPVAWTSEAEWRMPPAPERAPFLGFARLIGDPGDLPFTYRITTASLERALVAGLGPEVAAARFIEIGAPMPAKTRRRFRAIAERFGRIRAYESVSLLTLGDDLALRELLAATSLRDAIVYQISPRVVAVRSEAVDALVEELTDKGFTPGVRP